MNAKKGLLTRMTEQHAATRAKPLSIKNPVIVFDPPEIIALRKELQYHPDIVKKLGTNEDDLPTIIGILAGEVDIAMDGEYSHSDLNHVADLIIRRLRKKRGALIAISGEGAGYA